jgi:predicted nucleic acid-binding protein
MLNLVLNGVNCIGSSSCHAYNAVLMKRHGFEEIYSYDEDFDVVENVKRTEP